MLEVFAKECEIDHSEMLNRWSINLPDQPNMLTVPTFDGAFWNEKDTYQCQLNVNRKYEENKQESGSESSDSE